MVETFPLIAYLSPLILAGATLISISVATFPRMREIVKNKIKDVSEKSMNSGLNNKIALNLSKIDSQNKFRQELSSIEKIEAIVLFFLFFSELTVGFVFVYLTQGSVIDHDLNNNILFNISFTNDFLSIFKILTISSYVFLFLAIISIIYFHLKISHYDTYDTEPTPMVSDPTQWELMMQTIYQKARS
jgi:hypothetical protein